MFNLNYVVGHLLRFGEDAWILNNDIEGKRAIIDLIVQKEEIKGDVSILITLGMEKGQHGTDQLLVRDCLHPVLLVCFSFPKLALIMLHQMMLHQMKEKGPTRDL